MIRAVEKAVVTTGGGLTVVDLAENANGSAQNGESA